MRSFGCWEFPSISPLAVCPAFILGDQRLREMINFAISTDTFTGFWVSSPGKDLACIQDMRLFEASSGQHWHLEKQLRVDQ